MKFRIAGAGLTLLLAACSPSPQDEAAETANMPAVSAEQSMTSETTAVVPFIPVDFNPPILVEAEGFKLVPLGPDLVKVDFDAYMSSIEHLQVTFSRSSSWPREDISDADAMLDMETEQSRFRNRESFAYGVLTPDGTRELGSVYVAPSTVSGYDAVVKMWVTKADYDAGFDAQLYAWVTNWVAAEWPFIKVAYPGRAIDWDTWDALVAANAVGSGADLSDDPELLAQNLKTAEGMIDAFYSFDPALLGGFLADAGESQVKILYYQGWAEGGNYKVLNRAACEPEAPMVISCAITVQDDPVVQLQTGFNVTDTFHLSFDGPTIVGVKTSSDDQPIYFEARKWVEKNMPEVMTGPCLDRNKGGKTPGDCARAMTEGYRLFYSATQEGAADS